MADLLDQNSRVLTNTATTNTTTQSGTQPHKRADFPLRPAIIPERLAIQARTTVHIITVAGEDSNNRLDVASVAIEVVGLTIGIAHTAEMVEIWWPSVAGQVYQVQWASELTPTVWSDFGPPVSGNGTTNSVFDTTRDSEIRLYRVILP